MRPNVKPTPPPSRVLSWRARPGAGTQTLPEIPYLRLRVSLVAQESARLPPYKGSLLRGAFGHALRRAVCAMGRGEECRECPLRDDCAYGRLFEPRQGFVAGQPSSLRPFVFEPHGASERYRPGDLLKFDLLLFGRAVELQAYAVVACERLAKTGLGARRVRFELLRVSHQLSDGAWRSGYQRDVRRWAAKAPAVVPGSDPVPGDRLTLRLETPTRIKVRGRLIRHFDFRLLASRMLRRTLELAHLFGGRPDLDLDPGPLVDRAEDVRIAGSRLRWFDWQRYSHRQGTKMKLGGVVGELDLEGDLAPFSALLRTAEIIHVGKGATFGLGKVVLG